MIITVSNEIVIEDAPWALIDVLRRELTVANPAFQDAEKMGRWTGNIPPTINYWSYKESRPYGALPTHTKPVFTIPRGFLRELERKCAAEPLLYRMVDNRRVLPEVEFDFTGTLRDYQERAVADMFLSTQGILQASTGSGKTVMALKIAALRRQPFLVIVGTKELLHQWVSRIETFLGIPRAEIGIIAGGKAEMGTRATVAIVKTLYDYTDFVKRHIGLVIVDECHHAASRTMSEALAGLDCKYVLGLSATPHRRDRLDILLKAFVGDVVCAVDQDQLLKNGSIVPVNHVAVTTNYLSNVNMVEEYSKGLSQLTENFQRNRLIVGTVVEESLNHGICLVLSDRKSHCYTLWAMLVAWGHKATILTGDVPDVERKQIVQDLNAGKIKILISTTQLVSEGIDVAGITTLFLSTPIKWTGRVLQTVGRGMRPAPGKKAARVIDFVDVGVPVLFASYKQRALTLKSLKA